MNSKKRCSTLLVCAVTMASMVFVNLSSLTVSAQEPTEILSKRTAYEKHYDNHDGMVTHQQVLAHHIVHNKGGHT